MNNPPLWTANEIVKAANKTLESKSLNLDWIANGVSIDTRTLNPGNLFVCLRGPNFDGNSFIGDALKKGASAVIADKYLDGPAKDPRVIKVNDTLEALQ